MDGTDRITGKWLTGRDHLEQSIRVIITTPVVTRVMRREFGSTLPRLVDEPINSQTVARFVAATATALGRWEPRFILKRLVLESIQEGAITIGVSGIERDSGEFVTLSEITI